MAEPWGRLVAALGPPGDRDRDRDHPALRALRRPRPAPRHQTELLLLLLESPRELCGGRVSVEGSPELGDSVKGVGGALLNLLTLPPAPPPAPPRSLLLLATVTFFVATGDVEGAMVLGGLLLEGGVTGGAPAAAAECLRELRRVGMTGVIPPPLLDPLRRRCRETPGIQPLALLLVEEGDDPAEPRADAGTDPAPPPAFLLTPAARAQLLLLRHPRGGWGALGEGTPPYATGDPSPLHATLLNGGEGALGGLPPPPRLASLAQHPALPPPLRLFYLLCLFEGGETPPKKGGGRPPSLPPRLIAPLFPAVGGGTGDPPRPFYPVSKRRRLFAPEIWGGRGGRRRRGRGGSG